MPTHCFDVLLDGNLPKWDSGALPGVIGAVGGDGFLRRETVSKILQLSNLDADDVKYFDDA